MGRVWKRRVRPLSQGTCVEGSAEKGHKDQFFWTFNISRVSAALKAENREVMLPAQTFDHVSWRIEVAGVMVVKHVDFTLIRAGRMPDLSVRVCGTSCKLL